MADERGKVRLRHLTAHDGTVAFNLEAIEFRGDNSSSGEVIGVSITQNRGRVTEHHGSSRLISEAASVKFNIASVVVFELELKFAVGRWAIIESVAGTLADNR